MTTITNEMLKEITKEKNVDYVFGAVVNTLRNEGNSKEDIIKMIEDLFEFMKSYK